MTADDFRKLVLKLPDAIEGAHMGHPDFRINNKVFASLHADGERGVVMLTPEQQQDFIADAPDVFTPASGSWGVKGCTMVLLKKAKPKVVTLALRSAWENKSPKPPKK